jgi:hypothetical protein
MEWADPTTYALAGGITLVHKNPTGGGTSTFTYDVSADGVILTNIINEASSTIQVVDATTVYTYAFTNDGTWNQGPGYGGLIIILGNLPGDFYDETAMYDDPIDDGEFYDFNAIIG